MAEFVKFKQLIILLEGDKLTNIPGDEGGITKYGISQASYPDVNIADLTFEQACAIYERDFWNHYSLYNIASQDIANKVMSFLMNMDPFSAVQCLQKAMNACGCNVAEDGLLGAKTFGVLNASPVGWILDRYRIEISKAYILRVQVNKTKLKFLEGWINRALS